VSNPRPVESLLGLVLLALVIHASTRATAAQAGSPPAAAANQPPPVQLTAEQDHQQLMDLLHISSIRRGADGDSKSPYAANYDESKANPYPNLPDPLVLKDGKKVTSAKIWWKQRRPEIVEDFDREIYGRVPKVTPKVSWEVTSTARELHEDVPVITKKLVGHVDNSSYPLVTVDIQLTLTIPANATGPVPVIMEFGLSPEVLAAFIRRMPPPPPGTPSPNAWQQQVLARGWGYAILIPTSVQADNGASLTQGIIGLVNKGQPRKPDAWGALRAWAWGASRALDYFETDKSVDAKQVAIEGHSRYGKAALVAMAYDQRFAISFVSSSGEGGAKLFRRNFGEQVGNVAGTGEYHWMAGNFIKYAGPLTENDLPIDAHELIALCAPRPVFISGGATQGDGWVDAKGMFLAVVGAGPVYKLLGKKDLGTSYFPPIETALIDGDIAFRQHSGGHTPAPNWPTFLSFASRYIKGPPVRATPTVETDSHAPAATLLVALTFDDLPAHGPLPPGLTRMDVARNIIHALQAAHSPPVYGFVNTKRPEADPESAQVLQLWRDAGFPLGNHTISHMDLHTNSVDDYEQEILTNEPILRTYMAGQDWRWFRYPYLREGETLEKRHAIAAFLKGHGYRVAEVTLSFGDYAYNEPYARCVAKNDQGAIAWMKESYLASAADDLSFAQKASSLIYGRDINHVMLLHIGAFDAVMLPPLLELLTRRGFKLVTLQEAESDPAYATDPNVTPNGGGTLLQLMMAAKHVEAPQRNYQVPFEKLSSLCR
jgi:peptidoglycan/xylan/chitin deacetylase (PgdA/CDA1 family)